MHGKRTWENERLKKCQDIKYQTMLAKIRMDCMLRDRLEAINKRLNDEKKQYKNRSLRQKFKINQISKDTDIAYNVWSNSSLNQDEALKAYTSLFPAGQFIELGSVPLKPANTTNFFFNKDGGNNSTMSNTKDTSMKNTMHNKVRVFGLN